MKQTVLDMIKERKNQIIELMAECIIKGNKNINSDHLSKIEAFRELYNAIEALPEENPINPTIK